MSLLTGRIRSCLRQWILWFIEATVRAPFLGPALASALVTIGRVTEAAQRRILLDRALTRLREGDGMHRVRHGPFAGMVYPNATSIGSSLYPKILGCYERELHEAMDELLSRKYSRVVDIGCAEGYYAVGMAMRMPMTTVHAIDVLPEALELCIAMAEANGVGNRIRAVVGEGLRALHEIVPDERALVLCDCEGCERELFSHEVLSRLTCSDLLIECHDFVDPGIWSVLSERVETTHDIRTIFSVDDFHKALYYRYPEINGYSFSERQVLLAEWRPTRMMWLLANARGR